MLMPTMLSVAHQNGRTIPIMAGLGSKDIVQRGGIKIEGLRARFIPVEISAMQVSSVGPVPTENLEFLNFWWSLTNDTPREISAISGEIRLEWRATDGRTGRSMAYFAKDYWQGGHTLAPGTTHEEMAGRVFNGAIATKISVVITFVEFADGDRVGEEFMVGHGRADWLGTYKHLLTVHNAGVADDKLIDTVKPPAEDSEGLAQWGRLVQESKDLTVPGLLKLAADTMNDQRMFHVAEGVKKFNDKIEQCNTLAKAKTK